MSPDIKTQLDTLAKKIAEEAMGDITFENKLESFKVLTTYYVNTTKVKGKSSDDNNGDNFDEFRKRIEAVSGE